MPTLGRLGPGVGNKPVAGAEFRENMLRAAGIDLEFLAQASDVDAQRTRVIAMGAPYLFDEG